jgi:hypothetical protein
MTHHRVLVTGSRDWVDDLALHEALSDYRSTVAPAPLVVVHGACRTGADALADAWARARGIRVERHPALWRLGGVYNPQAGLSRNRKMVELGAAVCLAFIRSGSRGATHCAKLAEEAGIPTLRYLAD